jgi:hypothetical protein
METMTEPAPAIGQACTIYFGHIGGSSVAAKVVRITPKQFVAEFANSAGRPAACRFWRRDTSGRLEYLGRCASVTHPGVVAAKLEPAAD